ncbi:MAG: proton-conducting transporter membrane subunit, partial [Myxococcota bacterium]
MHELWTLAAESLALGSAALLFVGALLTANAAPFRAARVASSLSLALGVAFAACLPVLPAEAAGAWIRLDAVSATMLLLVASLGALIVRYSRTYLAGDPRQAHYARWLLATLGAVTTLVTTTHLVVLALAWTATSIALHQLLTFYGERTAARVAAHKKFLVSRLADLCLWSGFALVYAAAGTLRLDGLAAWVEQTEALPPMMHAAAVLFVVAACLKSAQLPFHGWLTQVMEAPTPVSALLHAGVVNLGGLL